METTDPNSVAPATRNVLVVDQERIGSIVVKMLSQQQYAADLASDGLKALSRLNAMNLEIIVADIDVPGGGIKLAELVGINPKYQNLPIILTSANPTPDMVLRARIAGCSSYLGKPFRPSELKKRIDAVLAQPPFPPIPDPSRKCGESKAEANAPEKGENRDSAGQGTGILSRVKSLEGLPAFPATHAEILKLAKSDTSSSEDLAEKLQLDPSLLATVFKLVNSSYYGFAKEVKDLKLAVTLLGLEEIANMVLAVQVFEKLGKYEDGAGLDLKEFWRHSIGTAFIAKAVAKKLNAETESAFIAGMMHDLGKIILDFYFSHFYAAVFEAINTGNIPILQAETEVLGVTHASVGGALAEEWKFPVSYQNAILYHHFPNNAPRYQRLVCIVHLADIICRNLEYGSGGDSHKPDPDQAALDRFSLGEKGVKLLFEAAETDLKNAASFLAALSGR